MYLGHGGKPPGREWVDPPENEEEAEVGVQRSVLRLVLWWSALC